MSLRYRLWLSFGPVLLLLAALGAGAVYALGLVGGRIDAILRENDRSVDAMTGLIEAAGRIDAARRAGAPDRAEAAWADYRRHLDFQRGNVTEPGEAELVARLVELTAKYQEAGTSAEVVAVAAEIRQLNRAGMERAAANARHTAAAARWWAALGLAASLAVTGVVAWRTTRAVLRPVDDLTASARAVGDGRFDQLVTAETTGEIGELVAAFNRMTAQLRDLRQTQAARLLRAQQAGQAAIDAFPDPILVVEPGGTVELANPAARRVLGVVAAAPWPPPEALREPLAAALGEQRPYTPEGFDLVVTYRTGGEERVYAPRVLPVRDPYGATLGAAVALTDVTRFRILDEFKSDLVATASHELKTPLAGLRLAVHLLLEELVGPLTAKQTELLIDARENTERLVRIVDHLLSLARLERGREPLAVRPEDPLELLRAAAGRVGPLAGGRRITVEAGADAPPVAVDAEQLGRALDNLLVNAINYTDAGGSITLAARPAGPGRVELSVADTGVGIPAEYVPHVFERFFRIPEQSRGAGTGLGLAIVKEVVAAHGGEVTCASAPGRGTTFRIVLPAAGGAP